MKVICVLCCKNSAERNAGVDYIFANIGPRIGDLRATPSIIPCFVTLTVESDICLVLGDLSSVGCGPELPHIAIRKVGPPIGNVHPGPSEILTMGRSPVTARVHFVCEETSKAGCGLGLPRIAYLQIAWQIGTSNRRYSPPGPRRFAR